MTYLGSVESDRASYRRAVSHLEQAVTLSLTGREPRRQAYALSMLGRIGLFRDALDTAAGQLDASIKLAEDDHWLAFLPWPQALRGEVQLARNDPAGAAVSFISAFARACQLGDPCWEAIAARGLALVAEAAGDTERAARCWPRPGPAAAGWPNPISGSTGTSSTRSATSACGTTIRIPQSGSRRCESSRHGRGSRAHPPLAAARRRARPGRRQHRRGRARGRTRRIPLARGAHAWDSHGYRSVSLAA